jgi:hypothetical protein
MQVQTTSSKQPWCIALDTGRFQQGRCKYLAINQKAAIAPVMRHSPQSTSSCLSSLVTRLSTFAESAGSVACNVYMPLT